MHTSTRLFLATALGALASIAACAKGLPGTSGLPGKPAELDKVPGGLPSGEVDPNTCGNYAAVDAGRKLKMFLQATKDLDTTVVETTKVIKQSCVMMGQELGMAAADLAGETNEVCDRVMATYKDNLKVSLKPSAKLAIKYKPAVCTVDAQASARASAECEGSATAGTGGSSAGGQCKAAGAVHASLNVQCTEPELTITADAKLVLDKSKLEMTLKAARTGLPKLLSIKARLEPLQSAVQLWATSATELAGMGQKFAQSFADQAVCISGQLAAVASASTRIQANVSISVSVTASASASAGAS